MKKVIHIGQFIDNNLAKYDCDDHDNHHTVCLGRFIPFWCHNEELILSNPKIHFEFYGDVGNLQNPFKSMTE